MGSGALCDAAIGPCQGKGSDEQTLLRQLFPHLEAGDVLVGDAFFPTYFLLCALVAGGVDGVFEQFGARRRTTNFSLGQRLGPRDHLLTLNKPECPTWMSRADYGRVPATLTVRELAAGGKILVTTLRCPNRYPKPAIKALYWRRWSVELDLRNAKTTLGMERLSCKSPGMVEKEIWIYLLAYNLIRLLMAQSALLADQIPRQLSFKHAVQLWTLWQHYRDALATAADLAALLAMMAEPRVGLRPETRNGDTELVILTNLPSAAADAITIATLYRTRWGIETIFQKLEKYFN
ncbi:IS4 family transposase, partial [uncultured Thiodictyon sp.]|uniref:IS4 family transposase n=1 Tax=uncultured Thiodictyon sp. TaxID=1846217 RepID=UPI0025F9181D